MVHWYSECSHEGITIQNSFPKGGPYPGQTHEFYNHSYLVFFTRITNDSKDTIDISVDFSDEPIVIPNSTNTYMRILLPSADMTMDKIPQFSYGLNELESLYGPTNYKNQLIPGEETIFYLVAFFYQTAPEAWQEYRGGNRAEFYIEGDQILFNMIPQIESLKCGKIIKN